MVSKREDEAIAFKETVKEGRIVGLAAYVIKFYRWWLTAQTAVFFIGYFLVANLEIVQGVDGKTHIQAKPSVHTNINVGK